IQPVTRPRPLCLSFGREASRRSSFPPTIAVGTGTCWCPRATQSARTTSWTRCWPVADRRGERHYERAPRSGPYGVADRRLKALGPWPLLASVPLLAVVVAGRRGNDLASEPGAADRDRLHARRRSRAAGAATLTIPCAISAP